MFWLRNKKNNLKICTLIWRPVIHKTILEIITVYMLRLLSTMMPAICYTLGKVCIDILRVGVTMSKRDSLIRKIFYHGKPFRS